MLPFGSITSLVPLSLLALAYLVYISASILNKNIPESSQETGEAKVSSFTGSDMPDPLFYEDLVNPGFDSDDSFTFPDYIHFREYACIFFHEKICGGLIAQQCASPFSPRPPPAM
jgi:hypothetical protein